MTKSHESGVMLTVADVDMIATRIATMWDQYNTERVNALNFGEEARRYVFATDIDHTSAQILEHKNRTHQPKLTQLSDTLQSQYFEASLSMPEFFMFQGTNQEDRDNARKIEAFIRTKLEQKKFRETTGRELLADYVIYGNCFPDVSWTVEKDNAGEVIYNGPLVKRISPLNIVFNPAAESFSKSIKLQKVLLHVAEISELPNQFPNAGFKISVIEKAIRSRHPALIDDWVETIKERGLNMDGYGGFDAYFKQDLAEILVYRGDVFNPDTMELQRNRIVYVLDKVHVIRNEPNRAPANFDGIHHAGWRIRSDNLWAQGPLDNLVGMQYRIDHLENLKADIFDLIAHPVIKIKGDNVTEPEFGYAPHGVYQMSVEEEVEMLKPDSTALNADTQIQLYHRMMEEFAGAPPETRGIRTPGEKTAFEVSKLDQNATMMFVDKARNFERMLESMLKEIFELTLQNFNGEEYVEMYDDVTGKDSLELLAAQDVKARGDFVAIGARHWTRRNRETLELQSFMQGPLQDPKIRAHVSGEQLARFWEHKLNLEDAQIVEPFAGVKEDVRIQAVAQAEAKTLGDDTGEDLGPSQEPTSAAASIPPREGEENTGAGALGASGVS